MARSILGQSRAYLRKICLRSSHTRQIFKFVSGRLGIQLCLLRLKEFHGVATLLPWVPESENLNERKLVRGKERRKKGGRTAFFLSLFFSFYYFLALVPRVPLCKQTLQNCQNPNSISVNIEF